MVAARLDSLGKIHFSPKILRQISGTVARPVLQKIAKSHFRNVFSRARTILDMNPIMSGYP